MDRGSKSKLEITERVNQVYWDAIGTEGLGYENRNQVRAQVIIPEFRNIVYSPSACGENVC